MFIWVEGPPGMDMQAVYPIALERNVAFVPGTFFYAREGEGAETMRLNFTATGAAALDGAVKTLASAASDCRKAAQRDREARAA